MTLTEEIAETIWQAEAVRATGRERREMWSKVSLVQKERYIFVAKAIMRDVLHFKED